MRTRRVFSWLTLIIVFCWQVGLVVSFSPTSAVLASPPSERPQRVFVDEFVAPHSTLAVALPGAAGNDPKTVALDFYKVPV